MARIRGSKSGGNGGGMNDSGNSNPPKKRHQRQRGHPDADAKIIELTPEELTDDRLFVCTLCNVVFLREQNLILHVRSHSIPSKLKKNSNDGSSSTTKKTAFICPIVTCRHHDSKRALSDITGIKKHYGRAHGEKKWVCTVCTKAYGVEADLKAHLKLHSKGKGAETSKCAVSSKDRPGTSCRPEEHEELAISSNDEEEAEEDAAAQAAAAAVANDNGHTDNGDILGIGELQDVYMPQFEVAPDLEEREQGRATTDERALLDLDLELMGSLPMGLTGLLTGCTVHPEVPMAAANSAPLGALFPPAAAPPAPPSAGGPGTVTSPPKSVLPTVDLNLPITSFRAHHSSNAGVRMLENSPSVVFEDQYPITQAPASVQKECSAAEVVQREVMMGPNASIMNPAFLSNVDGLQMPQLVTLQSTGNYSFPAAAGITRQQAAMNSPNPSFSSFAPFFGGAVQVSTDDYAIGGGSSDILFAGYPDLTQGTGLVPNGAGGFCLGNPSVYAPQQQPIVAAHGFSYPIMPGVNDVRAAAVGSNMNQPWTGLQMGYGAPPPAALGLANQGVNASGYGATMGLDLNF